MNNWDELKTRSDYAKWQKWQVEKKKGATALHYASALCFGLAAMFELVVPII